MRNFARITNYYNRQEAWLDWLHLAKQAHMASRHDLVAKFQPKDNAGWKTIDKKIALLREALTAANIAWSRRVEGSAKLPAVENLPEVSKPA